MNDEKFLQAGENVDPACLPLSRRDFLKISGNGVFIFCTPGTLGAIALQQGAGAYPTDFNAYLKIGEDGRVSLFCSKIEMGQGIITSMAQMLAEELDVGA